MTAEAQASLPDTRPIDDLHWQERGNCRDADPTLFFPDRGEMQKLKAAQAICRDCVVIEECRDYAMDQGIKHGVWGSLSERQRRHIRSQNVRLRAAG